MSERLPFRLGDEHSCPTGIPAAVEGCDCAACEYLRRLDDMEEDEHDQGD